MPKGYFVIKQPNKTEKGHTMYVLFLLRHGAKRLSLDI
jgi:hypothetical protein